MIHTELKVCLVHDWLVTYRGGEKVLRAFCELFPSAPIYTLFYDPTKMPDWLRRHEVRLPLGSNFLKPVRKLILPLLPRMIESFDLSEYDLILSSSSCVAKGAIGGATGGAKRDALGGIQKGGVQKHLCYIHSPMRYVWDQMNEYIEGVKHIPMAETLIRAFAPRMRQWDRDTASRVDHFIANSNFVKMRVENFYNREASVVHPPIDIIGLSKFEKKGPKSNFLIAAGALVSYKRFDLAIEACNKLKKRLIIAGSGPMLPMLQKMAGPTIEFVESPDDQTFFGLLSQAEALVFPGVEDFGMVAVEAMALGTPVIAYKEGGALDFIKEGVSGCFFGSPHADSLISALEKFSTSDYDKNLLLNWALQFDKESFLKKMTLEIEALFQTS